MSAYPFGGHPTFSSYLTWAAQTAKCRVTTQFTKSGKTATRIEAPSGMKVVVAGIKQTERLVPTMVSYLDRRLGLDSPFAKLP